MYRYKCIVIFEWQRNNQRQRKVQKNVSAEEIKSKKEEKMYFIHTPKCICTYVRQIYRRAVVKKYKVFLCDK